jgi:hypothetical protein
MTTQPIQAVLDPQAAKLLFATLSHPAGASAQHIAASRADALAWLAELAPRDRAQSALAVRVIALHHVSLHHMAQAVQGDLTSDLALRHSGRSVTASRMMDRAMDALQARQMMPALRAVALPAEVMAELAAPVAGVVEVETQEEDAVSAPVVAEASVEVPPPQAPEAATVVPATTSPPTTSPPGPEPVEPTGWVAKRLQALDEKLARGEALTVSQLEWLRRQRERQAEVVAPALAA